MFRSGELIDGRYLVRELLGEGTSGEVYRVQDSESGCRLALKIQPPRFLESTACYQEYFNEIHDEVLTGEELSTVPGLIRAQRGGSHAGRAYHVMADVGGHDLLSFAEREGAVSSRRTSAIVTQLCTIVGRLHAEGWIHRDIKPDNALIDPEGRIWLIDLGSALQLSPDGGRAGSPGYTAPEIFHGAGASIASDIFSLGCLLFRLAVMNLPYPNDTGWSPTPGPPFRVELEPALDALAPELRAVGLRMIAWNPSERPPSASAVAEELAHLLPSGPAAPRRGRDPDPVFRYWLAKRRNNA